MKIKAFRRISVLLILMLAFSQCVWVEDVLAKRRRSFSSRKRSSSSRKRSRSKSSGFSLFGSKTSKSKAKSYSSRSKTRSKKGSIFNSRSKTTSRGTSISQATKRANSRSKFSSSKQGQQSSKTYKQVVTDNTALRNALTPQQASTRGQRRTTFYTSYKPSNNYYRYSPRFTYRDPYDNFFFQYVTLNWLFHHWDHVDKSRFEQDELRKLEAKIEQMEQEGLERNPEYTMPGVDSDLQYTDEELENLQEAKEVLEFEAEQEGGSSGFGWTTIFLLGLVVVGSFYFVAVRRY